MQSFDDVRQVLSNSLRNVQSSILSQLPLTSMGGARLSNVGMPVEADDVVTLRYLSGLANPTPSDSGQTKFPGFTFSPSDLGDGLTIAIGKLTAKVTSGIGFDADGNIVVQNGSGLALDVDGKLTVNAGVGLGIDGSGFLIINAGTGLSTSGGTVHIPGGAITNSLLAALSVAQTNIQNGAVGTSQIQAASITTALIANAAITNALIGNAAVGTANIQNAAITNALIANAAVGNANISSLDAGKITTGTLNAINITGGTLTLNLNGITTTVNNALTGSNFVGLSVASNSNGGAIRLIGFPSGGGSGLIQILNGSGSISLSLGQASAGLISVNNSSGTSQITLNGSSPALTLASGVSLVYGTITMPKVVAGVAQFSTGVCTVSTLLSSITSAVGNLVNGAASSEVICAATPSGGSVTFFSSNTSSGGFFSYVICGS